MLTKRTNILFSEADWAMLTALASKKATSVGKLIRHAIAYTYGEAKAAPKIHPLQAARRLTRQHNIKPFTLAEIKQYISYGRK